MCDELPPLVRQAVADMSYYDEHLGARLNQKLVQTGEAVELERFAKMGVYGYAERTTAMSDPEGVFVKVKWVRINKGTQQDPQIKCRLVAQELAYGVRMDELYANTPSLSCVKMAMVYAGQQDRHRKLMTLDVQSAFLYGEARRIIYIELPTADPQFGGSKVGMLHKALYGTRDAPQIWQHLLRSTLSKFGFRQSELQPSVYIHDVNEVLIVVHVDDFLVAGSQAALDWTYAEMSKSYDLKRNVISSSACGDRSVGCLNRRIVSTRDQSLIHI